MGIEKSGYWSWNIPLPARRPFREAKLRIDGPNLAIEPDPKLMALLTEALEIQKLVLASPGLSIYQLSKSIGRCRKQLTRLYQVSWLSLRIVESIADGTQPRNLTRSRLLDFDLPVDWREQEERLGLTY